MLYHIIKPLIRLALLIFCRKVYHNRKDCLSAKGPLMLAVNHPNSFLDAIMVGVFFKQPVHFLVRGDVFKRSWALQVLSSLKCIPVYRLREGREYLHLNDDTFERCRAVFRKGGIVLIFSEGLCVNEWNLRPLRKGTARLAVSAWRDPAIGPALRVLPAGVNYDSFTLLPKQVFVSFGRFITYDDCRDAATDAQLYAQFNRLLRQELEQHCWAGVPNEPAAEARFAFAAVNIRQLNRQPFNALHRLAHTYSTGRLTGLPVPPHYYCAFSGSMARRCLALALLAAPMAAIGYMSGGWLYWLAKSMARHRIKELGHYDSVMFGLLGLVYPLWVMAAAVTAGLLTGTWLVFALVLCGLPPCARVLTVFYRNWLQFWNYTRLTGEQKISLQRFSVELYH